MACIKRFRLNQISIYLLLIIGIFMLAGCIPTTASTETNNQGSMPAETILAKITQPPAVTNTPRPTATPILPTLTPSPTNTPIPEPTPTLTSEQVAANFTRLMVENEGCELPCWWGIVPEETYIGTIPERFVPQGFIWWEEFRQLNAAGSSSSIIVTFALENGIIQSIKVRGGKESERSISDWERYSLDQVLSRYEIPSQVFVYNGQQAHPGPAYYRLLLFYETIGVVIDYAGVAQHPIDGKSQVCPDLSQVSLVNLFLYQPGKVDHVVELVLPPQEVDFVTSSGTVYDLISWEQSVGTSLEIFYETFKDGDSNNCFEFTVHRYR